MKIEQLFPSEFIQNQADFNNSYLVAPFYQSHQGARQAFLKSIARQEAYLVSDLDCQLYLSFKIEKNYLMVSNLLCISANTSWRKLAVLLDKVARHYFVKALRIKLDPTDQLNQHLASFGYQVVAGGFEKQLTYKTALVLGGGGARGAYQIGAWQALQESQIAFELVTGTSVGALNGGLILLGDLQVAKDLWSKLNTQQVLVFPKSAADNRSLGDLINQVGSLTVTAIRERGASTQPLQDLITETFQEEKMRLSPLELYTCATKIPDFKEVVHHFDKSDVVNQLPWLMASASFFPAMKATEIAGDLYMDGGYRNNLPEDVAIEQGARECLLIDVKGPGLIKKIKQPADLVEIHLNSPWSLGNFMVFDQDRSRENYHLGYLETRKTFGAYDGYWYTFLRNSFKDSWWQFCRQLKDTSVLWNTIKEASFFKRLSRSGQFKAVIENSGLYLLEYLGKALNVQPYEIYNETSFLNALEQALTNQQTAIPVTLSVSEWLKLYSDQLFVFSDLQRALYLQRTAEARPEHLADFTLLDAQMVVAVAYYNYLQELPKAEENLNI